LKLYFKANEIKKGEKFMSSIHHPSKKLSPSRDTLILWNLFLASVREVLGSNLAMEVQTPTLVKSPGTEPYLDFFVTQEGSFLPPSPEYSLKKLLAQIKHSLFEIRPCFRLDFPSSWHRQEFFMLEWYQVGDGEPEFRKRVAQFVVDVWVQFCLRCERHGLGNYVTNVAPLKKGQSHLTSSFPQFEVNLLPAQSGGDPWDHETFQVTHFSVVQAFKAAYGFDLNPKTPTEELRDLAVSFGIRADVSWTYDDLFHALMLERIEPQLQGLPMVFVTHYPPPQAALAELDAEGWALRFELYMQGVEIGNAYQELQDAEEYRRRWEEDNAKRALLSKPSIPWDEEFYQALKRGWPHPTCGIAIGLERLFALFLGQSDIHFWSPLFKDS
jgi:lysyl-tRNA synthetase class 2